MNFEQAIEVKKKQPSIIKFNGKQFTIFITPYLREDFTKYCEDVRGDFHKLEDKHALFYSTDGQFRVIGLAMDKHDLITHNIPIND